MVRGLFVAVHGVDGNDSPTTLNDDKDTENFLKYSLHVRRITTESGGDLRDCSPLAPLCYNLLLQEKLDNKSRAATIPPSLPFGALPGLRDTRIHENARFYAGHPQRSLGMSMTRALYIHFAKVVRDNRYTPVSLFIEYHQ